MLLAYQLSKSNTRVYISHHPLGSDLLSRKGCMGAQDHPFRLSAGNHNLFYRATIIQFAAKGAKTSEIHMGNRMGAVLGMGEKQTQRQQGAYNPRSSLVLGIDGPHDGSTHKSHLH